MRIDALLLADVTRAADEARRLEDLGLDGVITVEGPQDVFFPLAMAAASTDLDVATAVALAFPRSPTTTAYQAWDLQRLSRGRFRLGLGSQIRANVERRYSATWRQPVERMREFVAATRAVFSCWQDDEPLDFRGEHYELTLMQPTFCPAPLEWGPPPVLVGAMGPRMTRMAAAAADGVMVHPFWTPRFLAERTVPAMAEGLGDVGRSWGDVALELGVIVAAGRDDAELAAAVDGVRGLLGFYGSTPAYRAPLEPYGWEGIQPELRRLARAGRWDEMAAVVDDEVLRTVAVVGTPDQIGPAVAERLAGLPVQPTRVSLTLPYAAGPELLGEVADSFR